MRVLFKEAIGYLAASACALLLDMSLLWALVSLLSVNYLVASTLSFLAGAWVAYELAVRLAFRHHRLQERDAERIGFVIIGAVGLALNTLVIFLMVSRLRVHYLAAKCMAASVTFTFNFAARRQILFVPGTRLEG